MIKETIATDLLQKISTQQAWHYMILPYEEVQQGLALYIANDKYNPGVVMELEMLLGCKVELQQMESGQLRKAIARFYRRPNDSRAATPELASKGGSSKFVLKELVQEARAMGSSDIHLEPYEEKCRLRMRIDGKLIERYILDKSEYPSLVNKIKIQANLDIAEKRLPQDGRIMYVFENQGKIDLRVSVLPTLYGEKVVMRLLSNDATNIHLEKLGFSTDNLQNYLEGIQRPNGIVLISGPTGSGKTTTLYASLQRLNQASRNIITIEDPIEYTLEGINQVQLRENIGLDFPSAMRTFLRQDPDIIMVGEIRDKATAAMAIRASLTGHLVLSTVHTNSAWGIVARLIDMGIPAYLLADTLNTAVAQRLLRLLCEDCKIEETFDNNLFPKRYRAPETLTTHYRAEGCEHCFYTGYKGRKAIYEVIPIDTELAACIKEENLNVQHLLKEREISSLPDNAFELLKKGHTSVEEVYSILAGA